MRGAATSDLHLGYRAYSAMIGGRNVREMDVEQAWDHTVDSICDYGPEAVFIPGDIFHHPRVGIHAVKAWRNGLRRIIEETDAHVIAVQGNHDAAKTAETLSPIVIPDDYDQVHILTQPGRVKFETGAGERVSVACFPFVALGQEISYTLEPDPESDTNILMLHAAVRTSADRKALPWFYGGVGVLDVGREAERWDAVVVGDFHEFTMLHPDRLVFYPGAIERTSSNIWQEQAPKSITVFDTATQSWDLREIPTRKMADWDLGDFDLPPGASVEQVNECLQQLLNFDNQKDALVRFKVDSFPRGERDQIDWKLVRELKSHCLHFHLDLRWADSATVDLGDRREHVARSLADEAREFFQEDPQDIRDCAFKYLGVEEEVTA